MEKLPLAADDILQLSQVLKRISFFRGMSMGDIERFMRITSLYSYSAGATVFKKGDVGDALYVVHSGQVRVVRKSFFLFPASTLATLGPGELFGEMALIDQPYRTATVLTTQPTKLFVILNTSFNQLLAENTALSRDLKLIAQQRSFETRHK